MQCVWDGYAGESVPVNTGSFSNDMTTFHTEDDVLTLLIHLGYLSYDYDNKTVKISNSEVRSICSIMMKMHQCVIEEDRKK